MSEHLSKNVRHYRKTRGMTQPELAEKAGVSFRMIQDLEYGKTSASVETLISLSHGLNVSPGRLLEDPNTVDEEAPREKTREELLALLIEEAIKLDKNGLELLLAAIDAGLADDRRESLRRLKNSK